MLGLRVSVPIACFRKGLAREFLESERLPPPATCYGFLLSLVGETDRRRHIGCRICPVLLNVPETSIVLRTVWRVKQRPLGSPTNLRPDYQQLLAPVDMVIWLDSSNESAENRLEKRAVDALTRPETITRFGGLSLGESSHLVDQVIRYSGNPQQQGLAYLLSEGGRLTLPVWVDHVGSAGTRYVTGNLETAPLVPPPLARMPQIVPPDGP